MSRRNSNGKGIDRRGFLGAAALGGAALGGAGAARTVAAQSRANEASRDAGLKIVRVEARALSFPGEFAHGGVRKPNQEIGGYVEVETANGLIGHGITAIVDPVSVTNLTNQSAAPVVVGENAMNHEAIATKLYWALTPRGQTGIATHSISSIDIALWDLK